MGSKNYPFFCEELPDLNYVYQFSTCYNLGYKVYFNISEYDKWLAEYPYLYTNGYAMGFLSVQFGAEAKRGYDPRVSATIFNIIENFIANKGTDCILLYHCDATDNRHECRGRLFRRWHNTFSPQSQLIKNDLEVYMPAANGRGYATWYLGYIAHPANENLNSLHAEFEDISMQLIGASVVK